jgi:hypothetical protein
MYLRILFVILGNFVFLYVFWKRLKEDYSSGQIFTCAFYILVGLIIANILANRFFPNWWFWLSILGLSIGLLAGVVRFKLRFMESLEALVISSLPSMFLLYLGGIILIGYEPELLFGALFVIGLIILFVVFNKYYKRFTWYRSGRIGFSGLTIMGTFFLVRAAVAVYFPSMLSFAGKYEVFISAIVAFLSFLGVFNLARQKT